jgi:hypothetical protein
LESDTTAKCCRKLNPAAVVFMFQVDIVSNLMLTLDKKVTDLKVGKEQVPTSRSFDTCHMLNNSVCFFL